ncbi:hypothetical protein ET989_00010 [Propioniciclava sinopodophylli]|uniref:Uncharacterized protein n=1 Tax=Propioniciclava sinopodophylli TaxID=1837344 RepID=A0A4Q9KGC6_9ACTN|nr:hypothetical protein [Propioniciclava sinopodophylli]TBT88389.1 hypothetical protein ET989_00010 [Propioniciclava sinopodophylli]
MDHLAMPTATPVAVLSHIAESLGLSDMKENNGRAVGGNFMSDLRSLRDITISGNHITIASGVDVEVLTFWLRAFCQAAKAGLDLSKNVIVVQACEILTVEEKRAFGRNVWESALCPLLPAGLKVVFSFNPDDAREADCPWPPPRDAVLQLPSFFDASIELVQQIGEWLIAHGHASTVETAHESAKMLVASSRTVSDLYDRLAMLEITGHARGSAT